MAQQETQYQYFWLKIVKSAQIEASGKQALEDASRELLSSIKPQHQYIIPKSTSTIFMSGKPVQAVMHVRVEMDLAKAREQGLAVEFYPMEKPMNREQALAWIEDKAAGGGAKWAQDGLCVLCSVALEPVAA